jgi:hypothetical protein
MADMVLIQGAIGGLKTAFDIATGISKLNTMAEVNAKAIELQQIILSAQTSAFAANSEQFAMIQRIRDLEDELARVKAWETERQRYKLVSPFSGAMVYAVQKAMSNGEPAHYLCTNCYRSGKASILQNTQNIEGWTSFLCPICKSEARTHWRGGVPAKYAEDVVTDS